MVSEPPDLSLPPARPTAGLATARQESPVLTARTGRLFAIAYTNLIFTILTVGIYRFWAKTRLRRYVWRHVTVLGEGFEYTGTGKELLIGFLKAMLVLLPPLILLGVLRLVLEPPWLEIVGGLQYIALVILFIVGTYAGLRYRMSRTRWSGIRFYQSGSPWRYVWIYIKGALLLAVTLGLYAPYLNMRLTAYTTQNLHFGDRAFTFTGVGGDLFKKWLIAYLLMIPTLSLSLLWYRALEFRYIASHTRLGDVQFAMAVRGRDLFVFYLVNGLILLLSVGILFPLLIRRRIAFWCRWLVLDGSLDLATVHQVERGPSSGEGLMNFLDMDFLGV